jgi:hypothetical protein
MRKTKGRLLISLIPLLILAITLGSVACASEETAEVTPTPASTPQTTPTVHENSMGYAIEAFERFPVEWKIGRYIDLATFRQDQNFTSFYEDCRKAVGQGLADIGIDLNKVDHVSFVGGHAAVYTGRLDLASIRQVLDSKNYDKSTYLETEIWDGSDPEDGVVALLSPNSVLVTKDRQDAETCISVIKGWGDSLYDNEGVKGLIAKLPLNPLRVDIGHDGDSGLLATASTIEKINSITLEMISLAAFTDEVSAGNGLAKVAADFNIRAHAWNMVSVESVQIRSFVKSTGKANVEDIGAGANPLGYETSWLH